MEYEYKVVQEYDLERLETRLNNLLNHGWKTAGGICLIIRSGRKIYCQAVSTREQ